MDRTQLNLTFDSITSGLPDAVSGDGAVAHPAISEAKTKMMIRGMGCFLFSFLQAQ
jgi:hypothetical protein